MLRLTAPTRQVVPPGSQKPTPSRHSIPKQPLKPPARRLQA